MNIAELNALAAAILAGKTALNDALTAARAAGVRANVQMRPVANSTPFTPGAMPTTPQLEVDVDVVLPLPLAE
jgi:hypothetical protein